MSKVTLVPQALLDGEVEKSSQKVVELAKGSHPGALELCLDRLLPPGGLAH